MASREYLSDFNKILFIDPDWNSVDELLIKKELSPIKTIDMLIYCDNLHLDIVHNNNNNFTSINFFDLIKKNFIYEELCSLAWDITHSFKAPNDTKINSDLILYLSEYKIGSFVSQIIRYSIISDFIIRTNFRELIFITSNIELSKIIQTLSTPHKKINISLTEELKEVNKTRNLDVKKSYKAFNKITSNTFNLFFNKCNRKIKLFFQDHRNTNVIADYFESDKNFSLYRLGSLKLSSNPLIKDIEPNFVFYLVSLFLKYCKQNKFKKLELEVERKFKNKILNKLRYSKISAESVSLILSHINVKRKIFEIKDLIIIKYYGFVVKYSKPGFVLLNNYNSFQQKYLSLLCKKLNIKTFSCEHGFFGSARFNNDVISSDYYLTWGELTRDLYKKNTSKCKIIPVGNPLFPEIVNYKNKLDRKNILLSAPMFPFFNSNKILHSWSPIHVSTIYYTEYRLFKEIINYLVNNDFKIHILIHQSQNLSEWRKTINHKNITLSQRDSYKKLEGYQILISNGSTLILDALNYGVEVIVYSASPAEIQNEVHIDLSKFNSIYYGNSMYEVAEHLNNVLCNKNQNMNINLTHIFNQTAIKYKGNKSLAEIEKVIKNLL